jgi:hypothetical protein
MTPPGTAARSVLTATALAGAVALLAACGSQPSPQSRTATKTVTTTTTPKASAPTSAAAPSPSATSPSGPPPCATSDLHLDLGRGNGAAGSVIVPIEFTNSSGAACSLFGYPGVSFVTGIGGSQIGASANEDAATPRKLVTLAPGATAHALLQVAVAQNFPPAKCKLVTAHWLKIFPPGQTAAQFLQYKAATCSNPSVSVRTLAVQTVQPGQGVS